MRFDLVRSGNLASLLIACFVGCTPQGAAVTGNGSTGEQVAAAIGDSNTGAADNQTNTTPDTPASPAAPAKTSITMRADFGAGGAGTQMAPGTKVDACPPGVTDDNPSIAAGLDCDGDGGPVAYVTPSSFKVAFKRLAFVNGKGAEVEVIANTGTLANATVLDLTSPVSLPDLSLPEGAYPTYRAELYYFELRMPLNNPPVVQTLRLYLSDDDFPPEGNLGHHQGDITFVGEDGKELGWVAPGDKWEVATLLATRPSGEIGAGGTDPQTGHTRGLFGNNDLWNTQVNMQGAGQDILTLQGPLGLEVGGQGHAVTFSFTAKDAWFYEDFDHDGVFGPCLTAPGPSDACTAGGAWAAIFYSPTISIN